MNMIRTEFGWGSSSQLDSKNWNWNRNCFIRQLLVSISKFQYWVLLRVQVVINLLQNKNYNCDVKLSIFIIFVELFKNLFSWYIDWINFIGRKKFSFFNAETPIFISDGDEKLWASEFSKFVTSWVFFWNFIPLLQNLKTDNYSSK